MFFLTTWVRHTKNQIEAKWVLREKQFCKSLLSKCAKVQRWRGCSQNSTSSPKRALSASAPLSLTLFGWDWGRVHCSESPEHSPPAREELPGGALPRCGDDGMGAVASSCRGLTPYSAAARVGSQGTSPCCCQPMFGHPSRATLSWSCLPGPPRAQDGAGLWQCMHR